MVKSKSKVDSHKIWLGVGVAVAVLLLAVLLLYPFLTSPMEEKKAVAGKGYSPDTKGGFLIVSNKIEGETVLTGSSNIGNCAVNSQCITSGGASCVDKGSAKPNDEKWYCGNNNNWYKCDNSQKSTIKGAYLCNGNEWVKCGGDNKGDLNGNGAFLFNKCFIGCDSYHYCDGSTWEKVTGLEIDELSLKSNMYSFDSTANKWKVASESDAWYKSGRVGGCDSALSSPCIKTDGGCNSFDESNGGDAVCGYGHSWKKCNADAKGKTSDGGRYICTQESGTYKWVECVTNGISKESHTCMVKTISDSSTSENWWGAETTTVGADTKKEQWIPTGAKDACDKCSANQYCIISDVMEKTGNNPFNEYALKEEAISIAVSRVGCKDTLGTWCVAGDGTFKSYGEKYGKVCGIYHDWLTCTLNSKNVVADGGQYICDGTDWKKISDLSPTNTKGCSGIKAGEYCIASHLWKVTSGKWGVSAYAYASGRVGISTTKDGCVSSAGTAYPDDTIKDSNVNLCNKNNWYACDASAKGHTVDKFYCDTSGWTACGSSNDGKTYLSTDGGEYLCVDNSFEKCGTPGISESDNSWICDKDSSKWMKCDTSMKDKSPGSMTLFVCDGTAWVKKDSVSTSGTTSNVGRGVVTTTSTTTETNCTNAKDDDADGFIDAKDSDCLGTSCTPSATSGSQGNSLFIWSYNLPSEQALKDSGSVPARTGCCGEDQCITSAGLCKNVKDLVSADAYLCIEGNTWSRCGGTGYQNGKHELAGEFTCNGTKWIKKVEVTPAATTEDCSKVGDEDNNGKADCKDSACATGSAGDVGMCPKETGDLCTPSSSAATQRIIGGILHSCKTKDAAIGAQWLRMLDKECTSNEQCVPNAVCENGKCAEQKVTTCTDPDNTYTPYLGSGENAALNQDSLLKKTSTTDSTGTLEDSCDGAEVKEAFCKSATLKDYELKECPTGKTCIDGACKTPTPVLGDVDGSGMLDEKDAIKLGEMYVNAIIGGTDLALSLDFNCDKKADEKDAIFIGEAYVNILIGTGGLTACLS